MFLSYLNNSCVYFVGPAALCLWGSSCSTLIVFLGLLRAQNIDIIFFLFYIAITFESMIDWLTHPKSKKAPTG